MNLKRSDLAMYRVRERRQDVLVDMEAVEASRWDGFLGGYKGILTFILAAVICSVVILGIGTVFHIEVFEALNRLLGVAIGLIFSQCVRNHFNEEADENMCSLKREYAQLTKMSKEIYFA